jgi:outer membrane protein insertion porin family
MFFFFVIGFEFGFALPGMLEPTSLKVWRIEFEGNVTYNPIVLQEVIALESMSYMERWFDNDAEGFDFSESEAQKDVIRLQRFYQRRGFSDVSVSVDISEGKKWWQRNLRFTIKEGEPIKIRSLAYDIKGTPKQDILSNKNFVKQANKQPLRVGKRFEPIRLQEVSGSFVLSLRDLGFPYANAEIKTLVDSLHKTADLTVVIQTGPLAHIDSIQVIGNKSVSSEYVLREATLYKELSFSQRRLGIAQQELFNHHLFRFVTVSIPEQKVDSTVSLVVRVRENPLRVFLLRGGVGTEEIVRGEASWTHLNPFGNAHSITFKSRTALNVDAEVRQARLAFDYNVPYVFNTKSGTQTSPFAEYRNEYSFTLARYGINNAFIYQHSLEWQSSIAHEYTINRIAEKTTRSINRDSLELYNISAIQLGALYRQGFIEREIGWYIAPFLEFSGFLGTGTYQYEKLFLDIRRYIRLSKTMQLAFKTHTGIINAKRSDDLPAAVRLYAGGTTSVRGWLIDDLGPKRVRFNDDGTFDRFVPTGGKVLFSFSAEVRKKVDVPFRGLGFAAFMDGGQIWRNVSDVTLLDNLIPKFATLPGDVYTGLQYGFGGGMSYDSPIGPIRVDIAYKINPTEADLGIYQGINYGGAIRRWGIHFSIGHPF